MLPLEQVEPEFMDDVVAGESSATTLAMRWGISARTVRRARARLRRAGRRVRTP